MVAAIRSRYGIIVPLAACLVALLAILLALPRTASAAEVTGIRPDTIHQNGSGRFTITGSGLGDATGFDFGSDIKIDRFSIKNDSQATVDLTADLHATLGERDFSIITSQGTTVVSGKLSVVKQGGISDVMCTGLNTSTPTARSMAVGWGGIGTFAAGAWYMAKRIARRLKQP